MNMEGSFATKILNKLTPNTFNGMQGCRNMPVDKRLSQDLPDGSCFSRVLTVQPQVEMSCETVIKKCEYIGSFSVTGTDQNSRAQFMKSQLRQMQGRTKKKVLLIISLTGIKVCSIDGKSVLMAHALRRISFATCDPENRQFSFLAREPNGHFSLQYCHSFLAGDAKAVWKFKDFKEVHTWFEKGRLTILESQCRLLRNVTASKDLIQHLSFESIKSTFSAMKVYYFATALKFYIEGNGLHFLFQTDLHKLKSLRIPMKYLNWLQSMYKKYEYKGKSSNIKHEEKCNSS